MQRVSRIQPLLTLVLLLGAISTLWPVPVDAAPSFSILSTSVSPDPTTPGSTATVTTSIKNSGTLASGIIVDMEIYNSAGKKVAQDYIPANTFASGETKTFNLFWTTSGSQAGGTHTVKIGIFADHWSSILLWNNSADTFMVANSSPGVAFSIGNVTANPTSFAPGGTVSVTAVVTNTGSSGASGINVLLHLTDPLGEEFPNNEVIIENQSFAAHQTKTITFQHHSANNARQGAYTVGIGVFNASWSQLYAWKNSPSAFTIGTAAQLTFSIGTTSVSPDPANLGQTVTVTTHVTNTSSSPAANIIVLCEINDEIIQQANITSQYVTGLTFNPGQTRTLIFAFHIPPPPPTPRHPAPQMPPGTYSIDIGVFSAAWKLYEWGFALTTFDAR